MAFYPHIFINITQIFVVFAVLKIIFKGVDEPHVTNCILSVFQTPGLWTDEGAEPGSSHQRSASWGSADHLKEVLLPLLLPKDEFTRLKKKKTY